MLSKSLTSLSRKRKKIRLKGKDFKIHLFIIIKNELKEYLLYSTITLKGAGEINLSNYYTRVRLLIKLSKENWGKVFASSFWNDMEDKNSKYLEEKSRRIQFTFKESLRQKNEERSK